MVITIPRWSEWTGLDSSSVPTVRGHDTSGGEFLAGRPNPRGTLTLGAQSPSPTGRSSAVGCMSHSARTSVRKVCRFNLRALARWPNSSRTGGTMSSSQSFSGDRPTPAGQEPPAYPAYQPSGAVDSTITPPSDSTVQPYLRPDPPSVVP